MHAEATTPSIKPRRMDFPFDDSIPRHWFGGNPIATHAANGLNLLFPAGERFFIRSVRHYLDRIDDPELAAQVRGFFGQEGRHAHEHERQFRLLEAQGYRIRPFLERYEAFSAWVERVCPPAVNLAVTAALEHFTATMAERALTEVPFENAHPVMRDLLLWHAAEEIEHKAVAFEVLEKVCPSYAVRLVGLALGTTMLFAFWRLATRMLLAQDGLTPEEVKRELAELRKDRDPLGREVFLKGIGEYVRRDFHPKNHDNYHLARAYFAKIGRADG